MARKTNRRLRSFRLVGSWAGVLLAVMLAASTSLCAAALPIELRVDGRAIAMDPPPVYRNGSVLVPMRVLSDAFGADVEWVAAAQLVRIKLDATTVEMRVGVRSARVNGGDLPLGASPEIAGGKVLVPIQFLAEIFQFAFSWDAARSVLNIISRTDKQESGQGSGPLGSAGTASLAVAGGNEARRDAEANAVGGPAGPVAGDEATSRVAVKGLEWGFTGSHVRLDIVTDGPVPSHSAHLLGSPDRLVMDLKGAVIPAPLNVSGGQPAATGARAAQFSPDTVRVVLDLSASTGYVITPRQNGPGLSITLNHVVGKVGFVRSGGRARLTVEASGPVEYTVMTLKSPLRLVIDIMGSTLAGSALNLPLDDPVVKSLRVSQFLPEVTRVVVDLTYRVVVAPTPVAVQVSSRGDAGDTTAATDVSTALTTRTLAFDLLTPITAVKVAPSSEGALLFIEADGPIQPEIFYTGNPDRLVVDVPGSVLEDGALSSTETSGPVKRLDRIPYRQSDTRLVAEIDQARQHSLQLLQDQTRAVISIGGRGGAKVLVAIDPGHGGRDVGAQSPSGTFEKEVALDIGLRLARLLDAAGIGVLMTRTDDTYRWLADRPAMANAKKADVFLSIHCNSSAAPTPTGSGTESYYLPLLPENRLFAETVHRELVRVVGLQDRGLKERSLAVLRGAAMPAMLVEVAFLNHPQDAALLSDEAFRQKVAEGLFSGLLAYLGRR